MQRHHVRAIGRGFIGGLMRFNKQPGNTNRNRLVRTGLPAEPAVYDVLWRYVRDDDHELSLAIETADGRKAVGYVL